MSSSYVSVKVDMSRIQKAIRDLAKNSGLGSFISTEAAKGMDPYVPYREGTLAGSADTSRPFYVTYGGAASSYASIVYDGMRDGKPITIHNKDGDGHLKATKQWDKKWWQEHKEDFCRSVESYIERSL